MYLVVLPLLYHSGSYVYEKYNWKYGKYIAHPLPQVQKITPQFATGVCSSFLKGVKEDAIRGFYGLQKGVQGVTLFYRLENNGEQADFITSIAGEYTRSMRLIKDLENVNSFTWFYIKASKFFEGFTTLSDGYNLKTFIGDVGLNNAQAVIKSIIEGDDFPEFIESLPLPESIEKPIGPILYTVQHWLQPYIQKGTYFIAGFDILSDILNAFKNFSLTDKNVDDNSKTEGGWTPLYIASGNGHVDVVIKLLETGADINAKNNYEWTPLYIASKNGHVDVVAILLKAGADINAKSDEGWTPLHTASYNGHVDVVVKLLEAGADINYKNYEEWTPLHSASYNGHVDVVVKLLGMGARIDDGFKTFAMKAMHGSFVVLTEEVDLFRKNPIEYILKHHTEPNLALRGLENLEIQARFSNLLPKIHRTEDCLKEVTGENLWDMCGKDDYYYLDV